MKSDYVNAMDGFFEWMVGNVEVLPDWVILSMTCESEIEKLGMGFWSLGDCRESYKRESWSEPRGKSEGMKERKESEEERTAKMDPQAHLWILGFMRSFNQLKLNFLAFRSFRLFVRSLCDQMQR